MTIDPYHVDITWRAISPALRSAIEEVCTPRQVEVIMLYAAGHGPRSAARFLGVNASTVHRTFELAAETIRAQCNKLPSLEGGFITDQR